MNERHLKAPLPGQRFDYGDGAGQRGHVIDQSRLGEMRAPLDIGGKLKD